MFHGFHGKLGQKKSPLLILISDPLCSVLLMMLIKGEVIGNTINASPDLTVGEALSFAGAELQGSALGKYTDDVPEIFCWF